jgi:hypothetical protein
MGADTRLGQAVFQPIVCRAAARPEPFARQARCRSESSHRACSAAFNSSRMARLICPYTLRIPGSSWPSRSDLSTSAIWSSSIQVLCPCRRPWGVRPVLSGSHDAIARSSPGSWPDRAPVPIRLVRYDHLVRAARKRSSADLTASRARVADESCHAAAGRRNEWLTRFDRRPRRERGARVQATGVNQYRSR